MISAIFLTVEYYGRTSGPLFIERSLLLANFSQNSSHRLSTYQAQLNSKPG